MMSSPCSVQTVATTVGRTRYIFNNCKPARSDIDLKAECKRRLLISDCIKKKKKKKKKKDTHK